MSSVGPEAMLNILNRLLMLGSSILCTAFCSISPVQAQALDIGVRLAAGSMDAGYYLGRAQLDLSLNGWGLYVAGGKRDVANACADSDPPQCNLPTREEWEVLSGVSIRLDNGMGGPLFIEIGGGFVEWDGKDPMLEGSMGVGLTDHFELGVQFGSVWVDARSTPELIVGRRESYGGLFVGLRTGRW